MQNKANLPKTNVTTAITRDYENKHNWTLGEIKPNLVRRLVRRSLGEDGSLLVAP
jgi:hypothetical protein